MADFCVQCAKEMNFPRTDLAGLCASTEMAHVICEGCGPTTVHPTGRCLEVAHETGDANACFQAYINGAEGKKDG